jgi:hypothetical protein
MGQVQAGSLTHPLAQLRSVQSEDSSFSGRYGDGLILVILGRESSWSGIYGKRENRHVCYKSGVHFFFCSTMDASSDRIGSDRITPSLLVFFFFFFFFLQYGRLFQDVGTVGIACPAGGRSSSSAGRTFSQFPFRWCDLGCLLVAVKR